MNSRTTYAIIGFLIAVIGSLFYHQYTLNERLTELELEVNTVPPNGQAHTANPLPTPDTPDDQHSDPFDPFLKDPFGKNADPFDTMKRMRERMDELFENPLGSQDPFDPQLPFGGFSNSFSSNPNIDIKEEQDRYTVVVSPIDTESHDIEVRIKDHLLTLTFKTKSITEEKNDSDKGAISRYSSNSRQFTKSVTLSEPVDESSVKTHFDGDVLTITIQKIV